MTTVSHNIFIYLATNKPFKKFPQLLSSRQKPCLILKKESYIYQLSLPASFHQFCDDNNNYDNLSNQHDAEK